MKISVQKCGYAKIILIALVIVLMLSVASVSAISVSGVNSSVISLPGKQWSIR